MENFLLNLSALLKNPMVAVALYFWTLPWKGVALWKAAARKEKTWFVVLLLINTLAILEILYIFVFSNDRAMSKLKEAFSGKSSKSEN